MSYARTILAVGTDQNTVPVRNEVYLVDGSTGPTGNTGTIMTLPNIVSDGMSFTFRRYDSGSSGTVVTVKGFTGTQTINSLTSITLPGQSDTIIQSYNGVWYTVLGISKASGSGLPLTWAYTQPNGNGYENSSNAWSRVGTFQYGGTSTDPAIQNGYVIMYTSNTSTWYRARIYDVTNAQVLATSTQINTGTITVPVIINLGTFTNLPSAQALLELQFLATDSTGNTGITGVQTVGLFTLQLYG